MKRVVSLLALIIITNLPISCGLGCGPFDTRPNIIVSISSGIGSVVDGIYSEFISTDFNTAAIRAVVDETHKVGKNDSFDFSFVNVAYACSAPSPKVQTLTYIEVTSDKSVFVDGIEFESGEKLEAMFKIVGVDAELNVVDFNNSSSRIFYLGGFKGEEMLFQMASKSDIPISQNFTFLFTFDDGLEYQVLTPEFTVD